MLVEINDNLIEEILHVDAEFDNNATDETFEASAELIGILAENIRNQREITNG